MNLQKRQYIVSNAIRKSANGQECTLNSPLCNRDIKTTVFCHINEYETGKGKGIKGDDLFGFYACSSCHSFYDNHNMDKNTVRGMVLTALIRSQRIFYDLNLIIVR